METDPRFLTATMARVYMGQGCYARAVEIYRHLLSREPGRQDLADLLAEARTALRQSRIADGDRLVTLFAEWFDLEAGCGRLGDLRRLKRRLVSDG